MKFNSKLEYIMIVFLFLSLINLTITESSDDDDEKPSNGMTQQYPDYISTKLLAALKSFQWKLLQLERSI